MYDYVLLYSISLELWKISKLGIIIVWRYAYIHRSYNLYQYLKLSQMQTFSLASVVLLPWEWYLIVNDAEHWKANVDLYK